MTAPSSTESTRIFRAIAGSSVSPNNILNDIPNTFTDNAFGLVGTRKTEDALHDFNPAIHLSSETVKSPSKGIIFDCLPDLDPRSPSILSPTGTASTASSPGTGSDIWDSPETPSHQSVRKSRIEVSTPLTPLATYNVSAEQTPTAPESLLMVATKNAAMIDQVAARIARASDEDRWKEANEEGDYFQPKKLSRNLTKELQAIAEANAAASGVKYNLNPSFSFSFHATKPTSTRKHSKVKKLNSPKDDNTSFPIKVKNEVPVESNVILRTPSSPTDLQKVLEHIVPLEIHARLRDGPRKCVASLINNSHKRCTNNAKGPLDSLNGIFKTISKCNEETDYTALLEQIERLVQVVMCGSHRNAALFGPPSDPRMVKLQKLVSNLLNISKEDRSDIGKWARAISDPDLPSGTKTAKDHELWVDIEPWTTSVPLSTNNSTPTVVAAKLSYSPKFLPYRLKWSASLSVPAALLITINKPLSKALDQKDGFIYIFWDKENFGKVKIGHTIDMERRLEEWNKQCKRTHSYHKASSSGELSKIPHASRIERLIHVELKEFRKLRKCEGCGTIHKEWFDVHETQAVKVFQKWEKWIMQKPYALDHNSGEWKIRPEMLDTLPQVCEPVPLELTQQTPRRKIGGVKSKRRRRTA